MKRLLFLLLGLPVTALAQMTNTGLLNNQSGGIISDFTMSFTNTSTGTYTGSGGTFNHAGASFSNAGSYSVTAGADNFNSTTPLQTIGGTTAPTFFDLSFNNGPNGEINITNTAGINITNTLQFLNGITSTTRTNGANGGIQFQAGSSYSGAMSDARFIDGYVSKTGNAAFTYPVGDDNKYRSLSVTGLSGMQQNSVAFWNANPNTTNDGSGGPYSITSKQAAIQTVYQLGFWDWVNVSGSGAATVELSLPELSSYALDATDVQLIGWNIAAAQWEVIATGATGLSEGSTVSGTIANSGDYSAFGIGNASFNVYAQPSVFLQGAFNSGTALMNTSLNSSGILQSNASSQPYSAAPFNYAGIESVSTGFFAANPTIVDWVLVKLIDASSPAISYTAAGFIKSDGTIVSIDGTGSVGFREVASGSYYLSVAHRNHLAVKSSTAFVISTPDASITPDFRISQTAAYQNPAITNNAAMATLSTGVFGMWGGNANSNANVRYSGLQNDKDVILNATLGGNASGIVNSTYSNSDLNMNGNVRYSGLSNDKDVLLNTVLGGNASAIISQH